MSEIFCLAAAPSLASPPRVSKERSRNKFVAAPIDLGAESDQVFLVAYGTGIRFRSALGAVTAKIGGIVSQVVFADPAPEFAGLDQVNVRLSRNLIGCGRVDFELIEDGRPANVVELEIR